MRSLNVEGCPPYENRHNSHFRVFPWSLVSSGFTDVTR